MLSKRLLQEYEMMHCNSNFGSLNCFLTANFQIACSLEDWLIGGYDSGSWTLGLKIQAASYVLGTSQDRRGKQRSLTRPKPRNMTQVPGDRTELSPDARDKIPRTEGKCHLMPGNRCPNAREQITVPRTDHLMPGKGRPCVT